MGKGPHQWEEDIGSACDFCWAHLEDLNTVSQEECDCRNPGCGLTWCHLKHGDHLVRRLHRIGIVNEEEIQTSPISSRVAEMLRKENRAFQKAKEWAKESQDLFGQKVYESEAKWADRWINNRLPDWVYPRYESEGDSVGEKDGHTAGWATEDQDIPIR